jgi:gliding motility-associated-like protein
VKYIIFIFSLIITHLSVGQTNAVWPATGGYFHFINDSTPIAIYNNNNCGSRGYSICSNNGELMFYGDQYGTHYNRKDEKLLNSGQIIFSPHYGTNMAIMQISDYEYMLIYSIMKFSYNLANNPTTIYAAIIDKRLDNGFGGFSLLNQPIVSGVSMESITTIHVVRKNGFNYSLFALLSDSIYSFNIENKRFTLLDKIPVYPFQNIPPKIALTSNLKNHFSFTVSSNNDKLILWKFIIADQDFKIGTQIVPIEVYSKEEFEIIGIDNQSKFDPLKRKTINFKEFYRDTSNKYNFRGNTAFDENSISDNDSFLYFCQQPFAKDTVNFYQLKLDFNQLEINKIHSEKYSSIQSIKSIGNGNLMIYNWSVDEKYALFRKINNSNYRNAQILNNTITIPSKNITLAMNLPFHVKDHIRLSYSIKYDCKATVQFTNTSNTSRKIDTFIWYIDRPNGKQDTLISISPILEFNENGDYGFKVLGKSAAGYGYSEWYFDTLHIRIPEKPVANFLTKDTIVCRFAPLSFVNFSTAKDIHAANPQKWVWTFGDGETITTDNNKSVTHTYKLPGLYTVSLFYSNGYCDSTLVRNQYIKVVDAPVPGFSVKDTIGCAPFVAQFTDTTYENITKKEYFFSDNNNWETITTQQFSHTFNQAGKFRAVQRLYGFSGCITQSDSVWFYVSAGLTQNDTLHATVASYLPNNSIELNWTALSAAVAYGVYKANNGTVFNNNPFTVTTSTSIIDTLSTPSLVAYKIVGIDSCGSLSAAGRKAQPILLQGKVADKNTMAILTFTPYSQWQDTLINYQIEHFIEGNWMVLTSQTDTQQVIDKEFRQDGEIDKCYRIKATNTAFTSYSNSLCLPYLPMLFVPNAFSPNNDGINDVFKPITFGIVSYELKIYNRWGQQIALLHKDEAWEAKDIPQGAYYLQLNAIAVDGSQYFANEVIHLVR